MRHARLNVIHSHAIKESQHTYIRRCHRLVNHSEQGLFAPVLSGFHSGMYDDDSSRKAALNTHSHKSVSTCVHMTCLPKQMSAFVLEYTRVLTLNEHRLNGMLNCRQVDEGLDGLKLLRNAQHKIKWMGTHTRKKQHIVIPLRARTRVELRKTKSYSAKRTSPTKCCCASAVACGSVHRNGLMVHTMSKSVCVVYVVRVTPMRPHARHSPVVRSKTKIMCKCISHGRSLCLCNI